MHLDPESITITGLMQTSLALLGKSPKVQERFQSHFSTRNGGRYIHVPFGIRPVHRYLSSSLGAAHSLAGTGPPTSSPTTSRPLNMCI